MVLALNNLLRLKCNKTKAKPKPSLNTYDSNMTDYRAKAKEPTLSYYLRKANIEME